MIETNTSASFSMETLTWQQVMEGVSGTALHNDADWFSFTVSEPTTVSFHLSEKTKLYDVNTGMSRIATGESTNVLTLNGMYMVGNTGYGCTECVNNGADLAWSFGAQPATAVPEPSLAIMFGLGAVVVALSRKFAKVK